MNYHSLLAMSVVALVACGGDETTTSGSGTPAGGTSTSAASSSSSGTTSSATSGSGGGGQGGSGQGGQGGQGEGGQGEGGQGGAGLGQMCSPPPDGVACAPGLACCPVNATPEAPHTCIEPCVGNGCTPEGCPAIP